MTSNIALQVMANLAARHGYGPPAAPQAAGCVPDTRLSEAEQDLLRRVMGAGSGRAPAPGRTAGPPRQSAAAAVSLEELAKKTR